MRAVERGKDDGRWWVLTERMHRLGLMAAGLILIVAGSVWLRSRAVETRMAYETVIESSEDQPLYARRNPLDERPATMRAVRGH